jgi:hypothetical protein
MANRDRQGWRAAGDAEFSVGLKAPGAERGIWKATVLLPENGRAAAESAVAAISGVHVIDRSATLPALRVSVAGADTLAGLRQSPYVDYVEPVTVPVTVAASGCGGAVLDVTGKTRVTPGDILPWTFEYHRIPEAWGRGPQATGEGVTIAVLDVGIIWDQGELRPSIFGGAFDTGLSSGRPVRNLGAGADSPWTECEHGTRVAGLATAPRDGVNIVGVAWRAGLVTVATAGDVIVGLGNAWWIADGIAKARAEGARIFNMSFGSPFWLSQVADEIRYEYYRTDRPDVIFVGAAGRPPRSRGFWPSSGRNIRPGATTRSSRGSTGPAAGHGTAKSGTGYPTPTSRPAA